MVAKKNAAKAKREARRALQKAKKQARERLQKKVRELRKVQRAKERREQRRRERAMRDSDDIMKILRRKKREGVKEYIRRVHKDMTDRGFHHDAWYGRGAREFDMSDHDFYTEIELMYLSSEEAA